MFEGALLLPNGVIWAFFFVYGSFLGSFANVLIYRMQEEEPLDLFKKSHCFQCHCSIPFYLNIPIISWHILRGRCQSCGRPFSFRYPFVELLMAVLFLALFLAIGWKWFLLEALIFVFALTVASFIDWDQMILPPSLTFSGLAIGLLGASLNPERMFLDAFLGALLGGGFLWLISYIYFLLRREMGLGGGDVALIAWIGAVLGWPSLSFVILCSCFLGSLAGLGVIWRRGSQKGLRTAIPFGPFLAVSSLIYIFLKEWIDSSAGFFMPFSL